ncbi:MAG TPA: type II toxin-antitoxin system VapC family toxin [Termitinemataceae bacterium]|uniref:type II toxin-antitoxin system VapC family toxin n=1 Tax=Treponema sp. J25 TaxID=2094121 RepID=UPI001050E94D|nr:type II toxin-antitoxin system VapC family toxin [Treponema sp. J25]TCW61404.1 PIN domain nuclease [Treponema sp. J25]HOJ99785.1 type II toxin-antitoxin system VapC family toxin [Termitinemataceae bacterium]HOM23478.1 type II toxin-antitoxin system VapC family toxin [Termitinemataceae bacterium]HPQ00008.1 type II toxin-antitoxin system VapC family toxin [Termitinemataceae bacterium]
MNYLLDTHTFLWTISDTKNLSAKAKEIIKSPKNEIFVSAVSFWEISIKTRLKKLHLGTLDPEELLTLALQMDFQVISLTPEEAITYHTLKEETHTDPFDRMLIWQSITRKMPLISKDAAFSKFIPYGLKLIW